jgi:hypothetical protein
MPEITLGPDDPVVFAKCLRCDPRGRGVKPGPYYGKAYTRRRWLRSPTCENCNSPMTMLYEVGE